MMEKQKFCKHCGRPIAMGDTECGYCGARVSSGRGKFIGIALALILVVGLAAGLGLSALRFLPRGPEVLPENAPEDARMYLEFGAYSQQGLTETLVYLGYSQKVAEQAVAECGADWYEQAERATQELLNDAYTGYSLKALEEKLAFNDFTEPQIRAALADLGEVDWQDQANRCAAGYLSAMPMSRSDLLQQLIFEGFTTAEALNATDGCGADWKENALRSIEDESSFTSDEKLELILEMRGYTREEIDYALENR